MVYTLKIYPYGMGRSCYRTFEVALQFSFIELVEKILLSFDFDFDHLFEIRTTLRHTDKTITYSLGDFNRPSIFEVVDQAKMLNAWDDFNDPCPEHGEYDIRRPLSHLEPKKGTKFFFNYDFGDSWIFVINFQKVEPERDMPRFSGGYSCISSKGDVEQYRY